jgi:hypothetical protein
MFLKRSCAAIACASIAALAAGCASVAPLDGAELGELTLASNDDKARLLQAQMQHARETFGSVSFARGPVQEPLTFGPEDYDEYLAYIEKHPDPGLTPTGGIQLAPPVHDWPLMLLAFKSDRRLFTADELMPLLDFYLCNPSEQDASDELHGFGQSRVLWRGQIIYPPVASEIAEALETGLKPQEYEVFFHFIYWGHEQSDDGKRHVMLLPLPSDLCVSLYASNWPLAGPSVGRPLRIDKDLVNAAAGPLPRPITDF